MKTEKIIAAWTSVVLMFFGALTQISHQETKIGIICAMGLFTMFLFGWSILGRKNSDDNNGSR